MLEQPDNHFDLIQETLKLIELANRKGFDHTGQINTTMLEPWMPVGEIFCNTACAVIAWWLRKQEKITVWIEPVEFKQFMPFIDCAEKLGTKAFNNFYKPDKYISFESAWIAGLTFGLDLLLDKENI